MHCRDVEGSGWGEAKDSATNTLVSNKKKKPRCTAQTFSLLTRKSRCSACCCRWRATCTERIPRAPAQEPKSVGAGRERRTDGRTEGGRGGGGKSVSDGVQSDRERGDGERAPARTREAQGRQTRRVSNATPAARARRASSSSSRRAIHH